MKDKYLFPRKIAYRLTEDGYCRPICPHGEASHGVMIWVGSWVCGECPYCREITATHVLCMRKPKKGGK